MLKLDPENNWVIYLFIAALAFVVLYSLWLYILAAVIVLALVKGFSSQHYHSNRGRRCPMLIMFCLYFYRPGDSKLGNLISTFVYSKRLHINRCRFSTLFCFGNYFFNTFSIITCKGYFPNGFFIINSFIFS